ncbi:MAG: hypothetical protein KatS3mg068_1746 [Candidatus Sericytochromatia bacterium]|nr:MAG: hypothetical protein KatS3mg068_1746 [Candidatus Sericytochromatia bacterium]
MRKIISILSLIIISSGCGRTIDNPTYYQYNNSSNEIS